MWRLLGQVGLIVVLISVVCPTNGSAEIVSVDDPRLLEIREHILKAYSLRPEPVDQCSEKEHRAAIKLYTRIVSQKEQADMLDDMEMAIRNSTDDYFLGMDETIAALASTKIKYILFWEKKYINCATYRYPLTGRTITLHQEFSPASSINRNYTDPDTGRVFELINCYPFPKWAVKYYKNYIPMIPRLQHDVVMMSPRNSFIKSTTGTGGKFTEVIKFATNPWIHDWYRRSSIRTTVLLRGYEKPTNSSTNAESNESDEPSDFSSEEPYISYQLKGIPSPPKSGPCVIYLSFWVCLVLGFVLVLGLLGYNLEDVANRLRLF